MTGLLNGKVAIVTGGTSGIGRATVHRFLEHGAKVVIADVQDEAGEELSNALGSSAAYVHADVGSEEQIEALVAATVDRFGKLDIMHNNAGIIGDPAPMIELGSVGFDTVIAVNSRSVLFGHKFAARQFKSQGTGGSIITTASVAGMFGGWSSVGYTTAKHAVMGIIHQAAAELAPLGIRSNAIAPGVIMTAIQSKAFGVPPEKAPEYSRFLIEKMGPKQAMGRFGMPEDVANVALFLASDLSAYVNGTIIPIDGGASAITQNSFAADIRATTAEFNRGL